MSASQSEALLSYCSSIFVEVCAASSLGHFVNFLLRDAFLMLM